MSCAKKHIGKNAVRKFWTQQNLTLDQTANFSLSMIPQLIIRLQMENNTNTQRW
jgi:hypothetical protein